jgi:hypothetical protein
MIMHQERSSRYGINMKKYCAAHEAYVKKRLLEGGGLSELLALHDRKLGWAQHERLIHLIVTLIVSVLFLFSVWLFFALTSPYVLILTAAAVSLLGAYIRHYFFLENTVQRWYTLYDRIAEKLRDDV